MSSDIDHPNVIAVHEIGASLGRTFIVSDPIEGRSVEQEVRSRQLTNRQVIDLGSQIAHGIAAAHDAGVGFLGLDPTNVFITGKGQARIGGFGYVHFGSKGEHLSPEQVGSSPCDQRSDVFALGVMLYEMLTGLSPFRRVTATDTAEAILNEDPPLVSSNTSKVTPAFDGVIRRCLHKRPEDRFQSARNVESALQALVTVEKGGKRSRGLSRRTSRVLAAVPVVLGAALAFTLLHMGYRAILERGVGGESKDVRVAVEPFTARGETVDVGSPDRMTESVKRELSRLPGVRVVDPSRSELAALIENATGGTDGPGADFILRGTVERLEADEGLDVVRVSCELFGVGQAQERWAHRFDCVPEDLAALPADIAERVAAEMRLMSGPES
jgi:TolB-like protein